MKIQRLVYVLLSTMLLLGLASCSKSQSPKAVAEEATNAIIKLDAEKLYSLLSTKDKEAITLENFKKHLTLSEELSQVTYIIPKANDAFKAKDFKENISGDKANVTFTLIVPDVEEIGKQAISLSDLLTLAKGGKLNSLNDLPDELKAKIVEYVDKEGIPTTEKVQQIELVKEGEEWKIDLGVAELLKAGNSITPFLL